MRQSLLVSREGLGNVGYMHSIKFCVRLHLPLNQKKTTNSNNWGERTKSLVGPTGTMKRTMKLC